MARDTLRFPPADARLTQRSLNAFTISALERFYWKRAARILYPFSKRTVPPRSRSKLIPAGQSNIQGNAAIATLDPIASDPRTAPLLN